MIKIGSILLSLFFCALSYAEVKVAASVDSTQVALGDYVHLTLSVRSDSNVQIQPPTLPDISGLLLVGQSQTMSSQTVFGNGSLQILRTKQYIYQLQADKVGATEIPAIAINVDGRELRTSKIKMSVLAEAPPRQQRAQRPGSLLDEIEEKFRQMEDASNADDEFLNLLRKRSKPIEIEPINPKEAFSVRLEVDKDKAYVGEQVTASYYLYLPRENLIRNFDNLKFPSLKGFWKEDIEIATRLDFEQEVVNGRLYGKALLASYALFPIKAGRPVVDSYKVKCTIQRNSVFSGRAYTYTKASKDKRVNVLPLPAEGKPNNFTGAVGRFIVSTSVDVQNEYRSFEPFAFNIRVEGKGNAKVIELPHIPLPEHVRIYDKKEETKFFKNGKSYKEFTLYLIAEKSGELELPSVALSYFDPSSIQYKTANSKPLTVTIMPGKNPGQQVQASRPEINENTKEEQKLPTPFSETEWRPLLSKVNQSIVLVVLLLISSMSLLFKLAREMEWGSSKESLIRGLERRVSQAKDKIKAESTKEFGVAGTNMIYQILGEVIGEGGSSEVIEIVLNKLSPSLRREIEAPLKNNLEKFQLLGFAPKEMLGALKETKNQKKLLDDTAKLLKKIIKSEMFSE